MMSTALYEDQSWAFCCVLLTVLISLGLQGGHLQSEPSSSLYMLLGWNKWANGLTELGLDEPAPSSHYLSMALSALLLYSCYVCYCWFIHYSSSKWMQRLDQVPIVIAKASWAAGQTFCFCFRDDSQTSLPWQLVEVLCQLCDSSFNFLSLLGAVETLQSVNCGKQRYSNASFSHAVMSRNLDWS